MWPGRPKLFTIILISEKVCWVQYCLKIRKDLEPLHLFCAPWQTACLLWACSLICDLGMIKPTDLTNKRKSGDVGGQFKNHHLQLDISMYWNPKLVASFYWESKSFSGTAFKLRDREKMECYFTATFLGWGGRETTLFIKLFALSM